MSGGWRGSTRRQRLPLDWPVIRRRILARDGHQCTQQLEALGIRCTNVATHVDHIIPNDDDSDTNLTSLCPPHHATKSAREGGTAAARSRSVKRQPERHPGLKR